MRERSSEPGASHELLLALESRRLLALHATLAAAVGLGPVTWFVVDLGGVLGRFCGDEIAGARTVAHRLRWAATHGLRPSMCFPLDGPGALVVVEQVAPDLLDVIQQRLASDVAIIIVDQNDVSALVWLRDVAPLPGRA